MNIGDQVTVDGKAAEVIKLRKSAPVAVIEFGDGERSLYWYRDAVNNIGESGLVRGPETGPGGFADKWIEAQLLAPINNGPNSDELAESWGLGPQSTEARETRASARPADIPEHSPSQSTWSAETPRQAEKWSRVKSWYYRAGLCPRCSSQGAWGHQLGFSNVKPPCLPCSRIVSKYPILTVNGWRRLTQYTAPQYALSAVA